MDELRDLADILGEFLRRMERVLKHPPFNYMLHTAPLREGPLDHFHWHLEIIPKLTQVAGYEWGSWLLHQPGAAGGRGRRAARAVGLTCRSRCERPWYNPAAGLRE